MIWLISQKFERHENSIKFKEFVKNQRELTLSPMAILEFHANTTRKMCFTDTSLLTLFAKCQNLCTYAPFSAFDK